MTPSITATEFVPDCLRIASRTVGRPSMLAAVSSSSVPSSARPTSWSLMWVPSRDATTSPSNSRTESTRPFIRTVSSRAPWPTLPPGSERFWLATARVTSATVRL